MISVTVPVSYFFTHFHYNCYNHFSYLLPVQLMLMLAFHFCCIIVNSRFKTRLHLISTCSARTLTLIILDNQTVFVNSSSIECIECIMVCQPCNCNIVHHPSSFVSGQELTNIRCHLALTTQHKSLAGLFNFTASDLCKIGSGATTGIMAGQSRIVGSSTSSHLRVMNHNWSARKQRLQRVKLGSPFSFVRGQDLTMWDIVWVSPQGHRSVSVSRHFLLQASQCSCSVRKLRPLLLREVKTRLLDCGVAH